MTQIAITPKACIPRKFFENRLLFFFFFQNEKAKQPKSLINSHVLLENKQ